MAKNFRQKQSPIQAYLRDNLREKIICDKEQLLIFFSEANQLALSRKIQQLVLQNFGLRIPLQPREALEQIQVYVFDFNPTGNAATWNENTIKECLSNIRMNSQLSSLQLTRHLRGRNALPTRLPREDELIRGDKSLDMTASIIKRGLSGRPRRSRREGLVNFLLQSSDQFTFAKNIGDRNCTSQNKMN